MLEWVQDNWLLMFGIAGLVISFIVLFKSIQTHLFRHHSTNSLNDSETQLRNGVRSRNGEAFGDSGDSGDLGDLGDSGDPEVPEDWELPDRDNSKVLLEPEEFETLLRRNFGVKQEKPEWYEVLQSEIERLPIGRVVYNPPATMKVGVKQRIETRISRDENADLITTLKGHEIPKIEDLKISELMKVRLSGEDFEIGSLNEEEQIIAATGFTEWAWDVTPRKSGNKVLHLHVTLRIRLPFGEERKDHPIVDRDVVVQVNPVYSAKSFISTYWKWVVTTLLLPLIVWIWKTNF